MIISFTHSILSAQEDGFFSSRNNPPSHWANFAHWTKILRALREESPWKGIGHANEDENFHTWLKDTWQITVIKEPSGMFPNHIAGIDIEESSYTMLLIRFPL